MVSTSTCSAYLCSQLEGLEVFPPNRGVPNFPAVLISCQNSAVTRPEADEMNSLDVLLMQAAHPRALPLP